MGHTPNYGTQPTNQKPVQTMAHKFLPALLLLLSWLAISNVVRSCDPSSYLPGTPGNCNTQNNAECCKAGENYPQYQCSPPITADTQATMTINSFAEGGDGGGASKCDDSYHSDDEQVIALSTGWYNGGSRCLKNIKINANGRSVQAKVVDECDSVNGCDSEHGFQPPCRNNIVDASRAVWNALEIPESQIGEYDITWSDA